MKTIDLLRGRYRLARNMLTQSKSGHDWGLKAFPNGQTPVESRTELTELEAWVNAHETGRGVWKCQHYLPIYERHFEKFKGTEVHVVEIGVYSGGSLDMWKWYFGPKAHIYGVDIGPECKSYEEPGIDIFIGDQADPEFWRRFISEVPNVDIVIDDGGHLAFQQIATLEALLPHIRPGGVYLCEDVFEEYSPFLNYVFGLSRNMHSRARGNLTEGVTPTAFQSAIDSFDFYPFVTVIEKRTEHLDRLMSPKKGTEWMPREFGKSALRVRQSPQTG